MKIEIALQSKQIEALHASEIYPVTFYGGAKGGGKSHLARAREVIRRMKYAGSTGLIVRKTFPELLSNHIRKFFVEYPQVVNWYNKAEKTIYWPNGSITEFSYLQHTDDVYTYQGREYDDITIDEITQHGEEVFKILRTSNRTTNPLLRPSMFLTGNPGGVGHGWVQRIFVDREFEENEVPSDFHFVQAKVYDNHALLDADPAYLNNLKSLPELRRKAYLDGDWNVFEGQVFREFNRDLHMTGTFGSWTLDQCKKIICFDWGYNAPGCALWLAVTPENRYGVRRIYVYREIYQNGKTPEEWGEDIKAFVSREPVTYMVLPHDCFSNQQGRNSIASVFQDIMPRLRIKQGKTLVQGARKNRLALTHQALSMARDGVPYMQFHSVCRNLIRTLPKLVYDDGDPEDLDSDGEDHAYDALSLGLLTLYSVGENSGPVKADVSRSTARATFVQNAQGDYKAPDFWSRLKEEDDRAHRSWEYS